ncbi:NAD(P)-dependent oxidoreductase [Streptomyces sp. GQFP]|uniref:NAD(P)-dependent oxidoreductase n=1 Tax=Streptomyces sp. GQFP TaxID=2907545 RepID=UPI001F190BDC|nr:NAD(P)-binding domain-containing protein [Streptomyces sp. GQFP]UIX29314.1 NAD(P)-binding domain-containing protein [Streptomyces sp. GQFP]
MTTIGFTGAGRMGRPMVDRLAAAGHQVVVHARREEARKELTAAGVTAVEDVREAAASAQIMLVCLFSDEQLTELAPAILDALPRGAVLASHVTGAPTTLERLAERGRTRAVEVVDAPVSGTPEDIRAGRLTVLLGGGTEPVKQVAGAVSAYADPVLRTGDLGTALKAKLVNNLLFAANAQLLAAAGELADTLGIGQRSLLDVLAFSSGGSRMSEYAAVRGGITAFGAEVAPFVAKDVTACRAVTRELGVPSGWLFDVVSRGPLPLAAPDDGR